VIICCYHKKNCHKTIINGDIVKNNRFLAGAWVELHTKIDGSVSQDEILQNWKPEFVFEIYRNINSCARNFFKFHPKCRGGLKNGIGIDE